MDHIRLVGSVLTILTASCGGDGGGPGTTISAVAGGTVTSADGAFTLQVLPGALDEDTVITVSALSESEFPDAVRDMDVLAMYRAGPDGLVFNEPALVAFSVDATVLDERLASGNLPAVGSVSSDGTVEITGLGLTVETDEHEVLIVGPIPHFSDIVIATVPLQWGSDCTSCTVEDSPYSGVLSFPEFPPVGRLAAFEASLEGTGSVEIVSGGVIVTAGAPVSLGALSHAYSYGCTEAGAGELRASFHTSIGDVVEALVARYFGAGVQRSVAIHSIACSDEEPALPTDPTFLRLEPSEGRPTDTVRAHVAGFSNAADVDAVAVHFDRTPWGQVEATVTNRVIESVDPALAYVEFTVPDELWMDMERYTHEWPVYLQAGWIGRREGAHTFFTRKSIAGFWRLSENTMSGPGCAPGGISVEIILWANGSWSADVDSGEAIYQAEGTWTLDASTGDFEITSCASAHDEFVTMSGTYDQAEQRLTVEYAQSLRSGALGPMIMCSVGWSPVPSSCVMPECHPDRLMMRACQTVDGSDNVVGIPAAECFEGRATVCYDDAGNPT